MEQVAANGITIAYDSFGAQEGEPLLLVSGLGMQMIRWPQPFCEALAACGFRVIRFDNRDTGLSTHLDGAPLSDIVAVAARVARGEAPGTAYTLQDMAQDALGLLDALDIARAHIVGQSMGGMIAQLAAAHRPDRVASLTAIMSSTGNPMLPRSTPEAMALLMRRPPDPRLDEDGFLDHGVALARVIGSPAYPFDEAAQREQMRTEIRRAYDPAGFARQLAAIAATGDLRPRLCAITAPTLVIHGTDDALVPAACGRDIAANIQGAKLMMIEGMGHNVPQALFVPIAEAIRALSEAALTP